MKKLAVGIVNYAHLSAAAWHAYVQFGDHGARLWPRPARFRPVSARGEIADRFRDVDGLFHKIRLSADRSLDSKPGLKGKPALLVGRVVVGGAAVPFTAADA
jgi:hypothetical protein